MSEGGTYTGIGTPIGTAKCKPMGCPVATNADLPAMGCEGELVLVLDYAGTGDPALVRWDVGSSSWLLFVPTEVGQVCITRRIAADIVVRAGMTCLQRNPTIVGGVIVKIEATGELLVL